MDQNNYSRTLQFGAGNNSEQNQGGMDNELKVEQGIWGMAFSNTVVQTQDGKYNKAFTDQDGDNNVSKQTQTSKYNDALVKQEGDNNNAMQTQDAEANKAAADQGGNFNMSNQLK